MTSAPRRSKPLPPACVRRKCNGSKRSLASCRFVHCDLAPVRERFEQEFAAKEATDE